MCIASLIFNWKLVDAESRILKHSSEQRERQFSDFQVLKDVRIFVRGKMFTNASSKVSIGFTNITGTSCGLLRPYLTSCCYEALVIIIIIIIIIIMTMMVMMIIDLKLQHEQ